MPSSPTVIVNLAMRIGEDKIFQDTIYQSDGITPQNITGWSVSFVVHRYGDRSTVFITKTVGAGITLTSPTTGVMQITVANADTVSLQLGQYGYYVQRTDSGNSADLSSGLFTLQDL